MSNTMRLDWDQQLFDRICDSTGYLLDKGYIKAWFTWLSWVTIAAGLIALGIKSKSAIIICLGIGSGIMLLFTGLVGAERLATDLAEKLHIKKHYIRIAALILLLGITPGVIIEVLRVVVGMVLTTSI